MTESTREERVPQTFAKLADTLVAGYDVVDLLQMLVDVCQELIDAEAAGILLSDGSGTLEVVASTSEASRLVEMMQVGAEAGPGIESVRTGKLVTVPHLETVPPEWAAFRAAAAAQGYASTHALPLRLRLRETTIGTLNLFRTVPGDLSARDLVTARAFADVATIGILHERALREHAIVTEQLQSALNSRTVTSRPRASSPTARGSRSTSRSRSSAATRVRTASESATSPPASSLGRSFSPPTGRLSRPSTVRRPRAKIGSSPRTPVASNPLRDSGTCDMKLLTVGGGSYLTGSDIADAVLHYGLALTKRHDVDLVDIPFLGDGVVRRAVFTIGWRCETHAVTHAVDGDELVEVGTTFALEGKANAATPRRAGAFTPDEAAALIWPSTDGDHAI